MWDKNSQGKKMDSTSIIGKLRTFAFRCLPDKKKKNFLYQIITGDEKWIYFDNPKQRKSWVDPDQSTTFISRRNIHS